MARDDYDSDDDDNNGRRHNASAGKMHYGKTSDFKTTVVGEDGQFFGVQLPSGMSDQVNVFYNTMLKWISDNVERHVVPVAEKFAKNVLNHPEHEAELFGTKAGNIAAYSVILGNSLAQGGRAIYDSGQALNDLRIAVHPLANKDNKSTAPLSGNNEVVANARAKINGIFWQRLVGTLTGGIAIAPTLYFRWGDQKQKNLLRLEEIELKRIKNDPEKLKEYYKKKLEGSVTVHTASGRETQIALEAVIEDHRKEYEEAFKKFKSANEREVKKEIDEILKDINTNNIRSKAASLKRYGINTDDIINKVTPNRYNYTAEKAAEFETKAEDAIRQFSAGITSSRNKSGLENAVKSKYVARYGAFDEGWTQHLPEGSRDKSQTIRQQMLDNHKEQEKARAKAIEEAKAGKTSHGGPKSDDIAQGAANLVSSLTSLVIGKKIAGKSLEKFQQPVALDRILDLRRVLEAAKDNPPDRIPGIAKGKERESDMGYAQYVHTIFQQHQKDCNRAEIGGRFTEHFEKTRWNDEAIQKITDEEMTPYEYAVKTIAKRLQNGQMDAIALINLVGDKHKKIVHDDGHSFGPNGDGKDEAAVKAAIKRVIDEQTAMLSAGQEQSDKDINDKLGNLIFSVEDLKKALDSKELDAQQRSFIFTVFSDVVGSGEALCKKLGISHDKCQELRKESQATFTSMLDNSVLVLAEMIEKEAETLDKALKLTDKEKDLITTLAGRMSDDGKNTTDAASSKEELKSVETVVANAAMTKPPGFWKRLMTAQKEGREARKKEAEAPQDAPQERRAQRDHDTGMEQDGNDGFRAPHAERVKKDKQGHAHKNKRHADHSDSWTDNVAASRSSREDIDSLRP